MKALFLAGGKGTRLRPLTDKVPKPMVPVMGEPLLKRSIEKAKTHGVREVVLSTCYRADYFANYFRSVNPGVKLRFITEESPLGTGGAIKNAQPFFDSPFLVFNADIVSDIDYRKMWEFHKEKKADVTIAVTYVEDPTAYGVIEFDDEGFVRTFKEKPKPHEVTSHYINAGIYIFEPHVLEAIPAGRPVSVERETFPRLLEEGKRIAIYRGSRYWIDLGTPEKYIGIHQDIFAGRFAMPGADFRREQLVGLRKAKVDKTAVLRGPVYLGANVRVGAGAVVGPNVVIGANSVIGEKCIVENSILWENVDLEGNCRVSGSIITAGCSVPYGRKVTGRIYTDTVQEHTAV